MSLKRIAVVGPIPRDTITTHKGEVIKKYGCVTHPTIALAKLLEGTGEVIPISHVHKEDHLSILRLFQPYSNINTEGVDDQNDQGTIIDLKFIDQNNRLEQQTANMTPVTPEDVKPFLNVDCFVFVPITDFEISLDTLQYIKDNSNARIIFDAHGPTTFVTEDGTRLRKFWNDKEQWFPFIDVLKMNLEESICCWFEKDYADDSSFDEDQTEHLDAFAEYVLDRGVKVLYVTLDSRGAMMYKDEVGKVKKQFIPSIPVADVVDTTGCGDSFAGGLAYGFTMHDDATKAAQFANALGALRTQGKDFQVFKSLKETEDMIKNTYS
ncbi:carbohydrate kinase family protein [Sungkyunkwania multivorans]|uniref:Carbohydrate kinase family protein n=1 Tax=Sungkyunkwania multivorans TaxID=1173618 RepID=A0ABW3D356_9FLAO